MRWVSLSWVRQLTVIRHPLDPSTVPRPRFRSSLPVASRSPGRAACSNRRPSRRGGEVRSHPHCHPLVDTVRPSSALSGPQIPVSGQCPRHRPLRKSADTGLRKRADTSAAFRHSGVHEPCGRRSVTSSAGIIGIIPALRSRREGLLGLEFTVERRSPRPLVPSVRPPRQPRTRRPPNLTRSQPRTFTRRSLAPPGGPGSSAPQFSDARYDPSPTLEHLFLR